jgi:hypothetical protein
METPPHFDAAPSSRPIGRGAMQYKTKSLMYSRRRETQTIGEPGVAYQPLPKIKKSMSTKSQTMVKEVKEERIGTWLQARSKPTSAPMLEPLTVAYVNAAAAPAMMPMWISNNRKSNKKGSSETKDEDGLIEDSDRGKKGSKKTSKYGQGKKNSNAMSMKKKGKCDNIFAPHSAAPSKAPNVTLAPTQRPSTVSSSLHSEAPSAPPNVTLAPTLLPSTVTSSPHSAAPSKTLSVTIVPSQRHSTLTSTSPTKTLSPFALSTPEPTSNTLARCPEIPEKGCSVCGDGYCVSNPDAIFSFPGQPDASCSALEDAGLGGLIPLTECSYLPGIVQASCGCISNLPQPPSISPAPSQMPFVPPTKMPNTLPPGETAAPTAETNFCNVCGEGLVIANAGATVSLPGEGDIPCFEAADKGVDGLIDPKRCKEISPLVKDSCGCVQPYPSCWVCGVGYTIIHADQFVEFPGQPPFRCDQVVQGGFLGFLPSAQCVPTIPIIIDSCGCEEIGKPQPCNICGEGSELLHPNATVILPGHPELLCGDLSQGIGLIDPAICPFLEPFVKDTCGCRQSSDYPVCDVCGAGSRVGNSAAIIDISGNQTVLCTQLELDGRNRLLSPDVCQSLSSSVQSACGCEPDECKPFSRCDVCGEGQVIVNPDAVLVFPGQQNFTCAEFAKLGSSCRLDPAICRDTVITVGEICGCQESTVTPAPTAPLGALPTSAPSVSSTIVACRSNDEGNFGNVTTGTDVSIVYLYQVEMVENSTDADVTDVLQKLEPLISNAMIPSLFPALCGVSENRRLLGVAVGLSALPQDLIVGGKF